MRPECEQFRGRKRDLCEGHGLDGRENPLQQDSDRLRAKFGLEPIVVAEPQAVQVQPRGRVVPQASKIGTRIAGYFKTRIGQTPCGWCEEQIEALNGHTASEVRADKETLVEAIIANAKRNAAWWIKIGLKADELFRTGEAAALIGAYIDEACDAEESGPS